MPASLPARRPLSVALIAMAALGGLWLVVPLGNGPLQVFDGALMGSLAREMLDAGRYAFTVDDTGAYAVRGFSKPPFALWLIVASVKALGATLFALRLPSALSVIGLALLAVLWARRWASPAQAAWVGGIWGGLLMLSEGAVRYGGTVCIEPILAFTGLLAVYVYADDDEQAPLHTALRCLVASVALTAAFLTKQVAAGLAVAPIVVIEIDRWTRTPSWRGLGASLGRLLLTAALPLVVALGWRAWMDELTNDDLSKVLLGRSVEARLGGFNGVSHFNWLNRFSDLVESQLSPLPLGLSVAALGALIIVHRRPARARRLALGLAAYAAFALVAFELVTKSILEWYAFHLLFPLCGAAAFFLVEGAAAAREAIEVGRLSSRDAVRCGIALCIALAVADRCLASVAPRLTTLLLCTAVLAPLALAASRRLVTSGALVYVLASAVALALLARSARHEHVRAGPSAAGSLMSILDDEGISAPRVSGWFMLKGKKKTQRLRALFGPRASVGGPPWTGAAESTPAAFVDMIAIPQEVLPRRGVRVRRGAGGVVYIGDLSKPPFAADAYAQALTRGPLTFEAEHLISRHGWTLDDHDLASGGAVRSVAPWGRGKPHNFQLARVPKLTLPEGSYVAVFRLAWACSGVFDREELLRFRVHKRRLALGCERDDEGSGELVDVPVAFSLKEDRGVGVVVKYRRGEVAFDKVSIYRSDVFAKRFPGLPTTSSHLR